MFMGIPRNFLTGTVSVLLVRSRNIVERQAVQWIDGPKETGRDGTGSDDRGMKPAGGDIIVERGTPQLNVQELGQEQHEHEWQEAISELEGETQGALSDHGEDTQEVLSEDEREQQHEEEGAEARSASLEGLTVPAPRKLAIGGNVPPILSSRTRSRKPHTGVEGGALHCFLPAIEAEEENGVEDVLTCDDGGQMAMQATLDVSEPRNRRQAMESHEWDEWRKAEETEMRGMVENCVYDQVARPKDKLVIGTKMLYKRKIGQDGKVEKYKCRLVAQGFWQVEGVHYTEKYSPTPSAASIRMLLATAAAKDGELRHFDAEQAFLKADIDEEIYIEIPEEFQKFPGAVGRLNKAIYGLVQAGRCWNNKFCDDMTAIGFEQAKVDPCVFRKVVDGEAEMVVVVHVDDILAHAKDQATMNRFAAELGRKFKLKDMGDAEYYMDCHITRNRKARELKFDQHLYVESMVKRFNVKKEAKIPAASGVQMLSKADEPQNPEEEEEMKMFPYREAVGGDDNTAGYRVRRTCCSQVLRKPWAGTQEGSDEDLPVSSAHERMGDYVRWTGLWTLHGGIHGFGFRSLPGHKTIGFRCDVDVGQGSDQLALEDARSNSSRYLGGRVRSLIGGSQGCTIFETGAAIHGTVDEGRCGKCI